MLLLVFAAGSIALAQEAAKPEIKVSADLELFYEMSDDVGGNQDGDKFQSNQMYLIFDGSFENDLAARFMLDGSDIVSSDGKVVTEKIVEEANFTFKNIGGSPVTFVFGKDEMPFGLDYDKYLNDSISHMFEIDKVWGFHGIVDLKGIGNFAAATYQHRHSLASGVTLVDADNQMGDNYTARLTVDKLVKGLKLVLSGANESYGDTSTTDDAGTTTVAERSAETRLDVGVVINCPANKCNLNAEYISFSNKGGSPDYNPSLTTLGIEVPASDKVTLWGRLEIIGEDTDQDVETEFWSVGVVYSPVKTYKLLVEYANFNSSDLSDATDLVVAKGSVENALLVGVKACF